MAELLAGLRVLGDRRPRPHLVAGRRLQLDHVGAQVGEQHARERPGRDVGELDDPDPSQRVSRQGPVSGHDSASSWRTSGMT